MLYKAKLLKRLSKQAFASLLIKKHKKTAYKSLLAKIKAKALLLAKCSYFRQAKA
jgi:hypothetical protein